MNDRTNGRNHSYYEVSRVAIEMIQQEGISPAVFYDEIPVSGKKSYMLNYKGISFLAGLMGCRITEITETNEEDEKEIVVKCVAENPAGDKGWSWLSRPKQKGKSGAEDDWREKIYTHAKRNALRDLVPYGLFLEMLIKLHQTGAKPAQKQADAIPAKPAKQQPKASEQLTDKATANARAAAQDLGKENKDGLMNLWGLSLEDCLEHCEKALELEHDKWDASGWRMLSRVIENPVGEGVEQAVEISNADSKTTAEPEEDEVDQEETPEEDAQQGSLSEMLEEL